jgi:hypothetical protein
VLRSPGVARDRDRRGTPAGHWEQAEVTFLVNAFARDARCVVTGEAEVRVAWVPPALRRFPTRVRRRHRKTACSRVCQQSRSRSGRIRFSGSSDRQSCKARNEEYRGRLQKKSG